MIPRADQAVRHYTYDDNRLSVQDEFERFVLDLARMSTREQYERGLGLLDEYWATHGHRDRDGWLRRRILASKASILERAGQPARALEQYRGLALFGLYVWYEYDDLALGVARCFMALERHEKAVETLERWLAWLPENIPDTAFQLLYRLSQAYEALGQPVPPRHAALLRASAIKHGVEVPEAVSGPARLGEAIKSVYDAIHANWRAAERDAT